MSTKTKKKSPARIEKDRKRKAALKRKQTIKTVAIGCCIANCTIIYYLL